MTDITAPQDYQVSLASGSPRRRQLLALGGWTFNILPADIDETPFPGENPRAYVLRLAMAKAQAAAAHPRAAGVVAAADTTVVDRGEILGKPTDAAEARQMLARLRSRVHHVYTGIAVLRRVDSLLLSDLCITPVPMRAYTDAEIEAYIATGDPFDKAGAYAIQHTEFHPVVQLNGCYAGVVGLPLCHLARLLARVGLPTPTGGQNQGSLPVQCQSHLQYFCTVHPQVLQALSSPS